MPPNYVTAVDDADDNPADGGESAHDTRGL